MEMLVGDVFVHMLQQGMINAVDVFALSRTCRALCALVRPIREPRDVIASAYREGSFAQIRWLHRDVFASEFFEPELIWAALLSAPKEVGRYRVVQPLHKHGLLPDHVDDDAPLIAALMQATDDRCVFLAVSDFNVINPRNLDDDFWCKASRQMVSDMVFDVLVGFVNDETFFDGMFLDAIDAKDWTTARRLCECTSCAPLRWEDRLVEYDDLEVAHFMVELNRGKWEDADNFWCEVSEACFNNVQMILEMGIYHVTAADIDAHCRDGDVTPAMERLLRRFEGPPPPPSAAAAAPSPTFLPIAGKRACSQCNTINDPDQKTCNGCGSTSQGRVLNEGDWFCCWCGDYTRGERCRNTGGCPVSRDSSTPMVTKKK
jgi:hypothetical protein